MKTIKKQSLIYSLLVLFLVVGCTKDAEVGILPVIEGLENEYIVTTNQSLELKPVVKGASDISYTWVLDGVEESSSPNFTFKAPSASGKHTLVFSASSSSGMAQKAISIEVGDFTPLYAVVNTVMPLERPVVFSETADITWCVSKAKSDVYRLGYDEKGKPLFIAGQVGRYYLTATSGDLKYEYVIIVRDGANNQTPYIKDVFDFLPAPGQFVNDLPKYEPGDTQEIMNNKVKNRISGEKNELISLGGWGGYVVFGFDHTIPNVDGRCDFRVLGNAFGAAANPRPNAPFGGSCEPGVIMVAYDKNKNGKPDDDEWYEIKGSGNTTPETELWYDMALKNKNDARTFSKYEMTYFRPRSEEKEIDGVIDNPKSFAIINNYIKWTDNQGKEGYKIKNVYHRQSYYPGWVKEDKITYKGIRLADNGIDESGQGSYYVLYAYRYGYADNYPNNDDRSAIDIDWAVTKEGKPANLPGIDFVKVINGVDKENGWLGEASTEVTGAQDLHMLGKNIPTKNVVK